MAPLLASFGAASSPASCGPKEKCATVAAAAREDTVPVWHKALASALFIPCESTRRSAMAPCHPPPTVNGAGPDWNVKAVPPLCTGSPSTKMCV